MGRRNEHSRGEIREMTINKAEELVRNQGRAVLTARHLMAEIGYTAGTLYQVFEGLEDVVQHVNFLTLQRLQRELEDAVRGAAAASDRLLAFSIAYAAFAQRDYHLWQLAFENPPVTNTPIGADIQACLTAIEGLLAETLREATHLPEAEVMRSAAAFLGGVHGACAFTLNFHQDSADITLLRTTVERLARPFAKGLEVLSHTTA